MSELKDNLRKARASAKMTQAQAAERADVPQSNISQYETGSRTPGVDVLGRLARAYGVTISKLLAGV